MEFVDEIHPVDLIFRIRYAELDQSINFWTGQPNAKVSYGGSELYIGQVVVAINVFLPEYLLETLGRGFHEPSELGMDVW